MQEHSICPSCSTSLADYYDTFALLRADKVRNLIKTKKANIDEADVLENYDKDLQDIFNMLGIMNFCCRGHMTAAQNFYDYYETGK